MKGDGIQRAQELLKKEVDAVYRSVAEAKDSESVVNDNGVVDVICASPGLGKTYAAEEVAIKYARQNITTIFAMPTNKRAKEEAENVRNRGYNPVLVRGRNEDNCKKYDRVKNLSRLGYRPGATICTTCSYKEECSQSGYYSQFEGLDQSRIVFMPYESAVENWDKVASDVVVFDEDPSRMLLREFRLDNTLLSYVGGLPGTVATYVQGLRQLLIQSQGEQDITHLRGRSLIALWCDEVCPRVPELSDVDLPEVARMIRGSREWSENLESEYVKRPAPPWLADLAMSLDRDIERYHESKAEFNSEIFLHNGLLTYRQKRKIDLNAKLVVLDAYAQPDLYEDLLERKVNPVRVDVEPNWQVKGIERNTSKGRLKKWTDQDYRWFWFKLLDVTEYEKLVVYCHKDFKEQIEEAIQSCRPEGTVKVDHVFQGRGSNKYKDFDTVVIFGSCYPNMNEIGDELRALYVGDSEPISFPLDFQDGCYRDPRVNRYVEAKQLGEIVQCAHRIRPVLSDEPKQLILVMSPNVLSGADADNEYDLRHHIQVDHWESTQLWSREHLEQYPRRSRLEEVVSICAEEYRFFHYLMILKIQPTWKDILGDKLQQLAEMNLGLVSEYGDRLGDNRRYLHLYLPSKKHIISQTSNHANPTKSLSTLSTLKHIHILNTNTIPN